MSPKKQLTDGDETTLLPTALAAPIQTAYSDYPDDPEPARSPWPTVWGVAAVLLAAALVAAFVIAIVGWAVNKSHEDQPPAWPGPYTPVAVPTVSLPLTTVISVAPTTVTAAAPVPRTVTVSPEPTTVTVQAAPSRVPTTDDNDEAFLAALRRNQINIYDQSKVLFGAHWVCTQLGNGNSKTDVLAAVKRGNPNLTEMGGIDFVADSIVYYCPQYEGE